MSVTGFRRENTLRELISYDGTQPGALAGPVQPVVGGWFAPSSENRRYHKNKPFAFYELRFHESLLNHLIIYYSSSRQQEVAKARTERAEEHARGRIGDSRDGAGAGLRAR